MLSPGKLVGIDRSFPLDLQYRQCQIDLDQIVKLERKPPQAGATSLRQIFDISAVGMLIVKIAYCFAVAEFGLSRFQGDEIRQLLCDQRDDVYNFFGGSLNGERLTNRHLHWISFRERVGFLTVIVHLFSSLNAPPYEFVVGPR